MAPHQPASSSPPRLSPCGSMRVRRSTLTFQGLVCLLGELRESLGACSRGGKDSLSFCPGPALYLSWSLAGGCGFGDSSLLFS